MKRMVYVLIAVCLFTLSACSGAGPSGEPVTAAEDVVGVWSRTERWTVVQPIPEMYMQVRADGTMGFSRVPGSDYEWMSLDFAFEGTRFSVTETALRGFVSNQPQEMSCAGAVGAPTGVYEVQLLESGNLKFANAQDNCQIRREILAMAEWEPVQ
jgi:hypothetical protein